MGVLVVVVWWRWSPPAQRFLAVPWGLEEEEKEPIGVLPEFRAQLGEHSVAISR